MLKAVTNVNDVLGPMIVGMDPTKQQEIDDVRRVPCGRITEKAVCVRGGEA